MVHRNRIAAALVAVLSAASCRAGAAEDAPKAAAKPAGKAYSDPRVLVVSPSPAPVPALKYRLLPLESRRTPGDAAPVYIRLGARATPEEKQEIVDRWAKTLEQLEFGARRQTCDWNYTVPEQKEDVVEVLMPDVNDMRNWTR